MRNVIHLIIVAVLVLASPIAARAEDQKKTIDHSDFTTLLKRYVDDVGQVDYKAWQAKDVPALDAYLAKLAVVKDEAKLEKNERLALWINAYNAITLRAMLEFYPLKSIKDKVSHAPWGYNVWKEYKRTIAEREVFLDHIENEILRKMGEPRIHFAINCASKGCPILRSEVYEGARLDAQLDDQVQKFLANPTKFKVEAEAKVVRVSPIFKWFGGDFGSSESERLAWLAKHAKDEATRKVLTDTDATMKFLDYDWSLNEKPVRE